MELFMKNGYFSKTALILMMTYSAVLLKFLVGGMTIAGLSIPVLDAGTATALLGAATTLYFTTHNLTQWKGNGNGGDNGGVKPADNSPVGSANPPVGK